MEIIYMLAARSLTTAVAIVPAESQVNRRQYNQQDRIQQGARSGALNGQETYRLERNQGRIDRAEHRMRASGGRLTYRERARLDHRRDRASARIYRQKHERQGY